MKKVLMGVLLAALYLVLAGITALATEQRAQGWGSTYSTNQLFGVTVLNPQGDELGWIQDVVIDSRGHVPFVVVFQVGMWGIGGKAVAVPYRALTFDRTGRHLVLDATKEKFLSAPDYRMRDLADEKWAEGVYRYFGRQPYWTEGESLPSQPAGTTGE